MRIIAGEWRGRRIDAPPGRDTRPTSDRAREAWMSMIASEIPQARVLDLFAGSGALGLEALSRGAAHATFVEHSAAALKVLGANVALLKAEERTTVVRTDALRYAASLAPGSFDVALADPPYGEGAATDLARLFAASPFASLLCIEHSTREPLPDAADSRSRRQGDTVLTFLRATG